MSGGSKAREFLLLLLVSSLILPLHLPLLLLSLLPLPLLLLLLLLLLLRLLLLSLPHQTAHACAALRWAPAPLGPCTAKGRTGMSGRRAGRCVSVRRAEGG